MTDDVVTHDYRPDYYAGRGPACHLCGRPAHDPVHTRYEVRVDGASYKVVTPYEIVTPQIQAVLDAAVETERWLSEKSWGMGALHGGPARLCDKVRAYLASIEPPKPPEPFTKVISRDVRTDEWAINRTVGFFGHQEHWECEIRPIRRVEP